MFRTTMLAALLTLAFAPWAAAQAYYSAGAGGTMATDGYVPSVISVGRPAKPTLSGTYANGEYYPNNPYSPPAFAENFANRIRVVDADGNFRVRYYGPDAVPGGQQDGRYLGANWYGPQPLREMANQDHDNSMRRRSWGYGEGLPYQPQTQYVPSNNYSGRGYSQPVQKQSNSAPKRSSGSSSFAKSQAQFNAIMAQSNAQIANINARSANFRSQSAQNLNNYGASLRSSMNGSMPNFGGGGGSGRGTQTIIMDDNQPRRR